MRCRAYAKALHYKERELRDLSTSNGPFGTLGPLRASDTSQQAGIETTDSYLCASITASTRTVPDASGRNPIPMQTFESLITLYSKLQLPEAATGVLQYASKEGFKPAASWYCILLHFL